MTRKTKDQLEYLLKFLTLLGSVIAFVFTIQTWRQQTHIKRAEFLEDKIKEFESPSTYLARSILDSFSVSFESNDSLSDQKLVDIGSSRTDTLGRDIQRSNLDSTLGLELPIIDKTKHRVRRSFDNLLDFFGKLEYYASLKLMRKKEINYFEYYIKKCAENEAVMEYARRYEFKSFLSLLKRMGL